MKLVHSVLVVALAALVASPAMAAPPKGKGGGKGDKGGPTYVAPKPPEYTTGYVKSYDAAAHLLTLNTGSQFRLAPMIASTPHQPGEKVNVRWTLQGSHRYADEVVVTAPAPPVAEAAAPAAPAAGGEPAPTASTVAAPAAPTG